MLQLENSTPFAANMAIFPNENAVDTFYLIVKASFMMGNKWSLSDEQTPPFSEDVYWGEPENSSLKYASDFHTGKPATDIMMIGFACAPNKEAVNQLDVSLTVGQATKTVRVFGDREWQNGSITTPQPFKTMPLIYEKAYGGKQVSDGEIEDCEERNPVGQGFAGNRSADEMNGMALPNLEDPEHLIRQPYDCPVPACFAFSAPGWQPRAAHAGTYDEAWQQQRAPYLPTDFSHYFFNMSHQDLIYPGFMGGGERVEITNMHPDGVLRFNLPIINLRSKILVENQIERPSFNLETILLEPNQLKLSMVWKAALPCDKKALKIKQAGVALSR